MFTNKPRLTIEEAIKKVAELKPEFDKINEYNKKLEFWHSNGFEIGTLTYSTKDPSEKENTLEKKISIYPENTDEIKAFKKFYHRIFHEENFNTLETSKQKYWQLIKDGANPIPLTKNIITEIDQEYEANNKFKDIGLNSLRSYCNGYDTSENGLIKSFLNDPSFHNNMLSFCTGEVHELYRRFLVEQLHLLETKKQDRFNQDEKLNISYKLIGENKFDTIRPVFQHIRKVLIENNISSIEAKNILLDMYDAISPKLYSNVCEPIINYLGQIDFVFQLKNTTTKQKAITIFYGYYKDIAGKPHGKQKQYAALLGDYFEGYKTENVSSNFNK